MLKRLAGLLAFLALFPMAGAAQTDTLQTTVSITVEAPPAPPPDSIVVTPSSAIGAIGDTLTFTYEVVDAEGLPAENPPAVSWSVSNGNKAGIIDFNANTIRVELLDSGAVNVIGEAIVDSGGDPDPTPPPSDGDWLTDPPEGYVLATRNDFPDTLHTAGWEGRTSCCNGVSTLDLVQGASPLGDNDTFARFTYHVGYADGMGTAHLNYLNPGLPDNTESIFVRVKFRLSENWNFHDSGVNKQWYLQVRSAPCGSQRPWIFNMEGSDTPYGRTGYVGQCTESLIDRYSTARTDSLTYYPGDWTEIAWQVVGATDDTGFLRSWVNGYLGINEPRQTMPEGYPIRIQGLHGAPVWGGRFEAIEVPQYLDIAAVEIWIPGA